MDSQDSVSQKPSQSEISLLRSHHDISQKSSTINLSQGFLLSSHDKLMIILDIEEAPSKTPAESSTQLWTPPDGGLQAWLCVVGGFCVRGFGVEARLPYPDRLQGYIC